MFNPKQNKFLHLPQGVAPPMRRPMPTGLHTMPIPGQHQMPNASGRWDKLEQYLQPQPAAVPGIPGLPGKPRDEEPV